MNLQQTIQVAALLAGDKGADISITPESIALLLKIASLKHFRRKLGMPEQYSPGMPLPQQVTEISQENKQALRPFLVMRGDYGGNPIAVNTVSGYADIPQGCCYISTLSYKRLIKGTTIKEKSIELVTDTQWIDRVSSALIYPNYEYPIANIQKNFILFIPRDLRRVNMIYYRWPTAPVYATINTRGYAEYDPDNSVDLEWDEDNQIDIIYILLADLAIPIGKPEVYQVADLVKKGGV